MDLMTIKESATLLKEIEEPTESLVTEGIFFAMLIHQESRPPTQTEVLRAMYALDGVDPEDDVDGRINSAILNQTVAVRFDDERTDFLLSPADVREWWKVTMRYLINYMENLGLTDQVPDKFHRQLIQTVSPFLASMVASNKLPNVYPWEEA
jgi:hypothetical protein